MPFHRSVYNVKVYKQKISLTINNNSAYISQSLISPQHSPKSTWQRKEQVKKHLTIFLLNVQTTTAWALVQIYLFSTFQCTADPMHGHVTNLDTSDYSLICPWQHRVMPSPDIKKLLIVSPN